ncbi:hypothetical protein EJB05_54108, partial [Eragrostis curvula]
LVEDIKKRTDFLRSLLVAEGECHVAGARPQYLVEAEARFAVLEGRVRSVGAARRRGACGQEEEEEEMERLPEEEEDGGSGSVSGTESECSCTDSLQEAAEGDADRVAVEAPVDAAPEATTDMNRDSVVTREEAAPVAVAKKPDTECAAVDTRRQRQEARRRAPGRGGEEEEDRAALLVEAERRVVRRRRRRRGGRGSSIHTNFHYEFGYQYKVEVFCVDVGAAMMQVRSDAEAQAPIKLNLTYN